MNKNVEQHLDELIEYYKETSIDDAGYLKKLFVRNLGDVKRRYIKYDKPKFDNLQQENQQLKIQISAREEEYEKLKDNWDKLKAFLETNWKETQYIWFVKIINKMRDIEQGCDSDE